MRGTKGEISTTRVPVRKPTFIETGSTGSCLRVTEAAVLEAFTAIPSKWSRRMPGGSVVKSRKASGRIPDRQIPPRRGDARGAAGLRP